MKIDTQHFILTLVLLLFLVTACGENPNAPESEASISRDEEGEKYIEAFGKIKPEVVKNITLDFPVRIETIFVKNGQIVEKGDTILLFASSQDLEIEINNKEYELMNARLKYKELGFNNYSSKSDLVVLHKKKIDNLAFELEGLKQKKINDSIQDNNIVCSIEKGIITEIKYSEGDTILPEDSVFSIIDSNRIIVEADIPEEFIKDVEIGNAVDIIPTADSSRVFKGTVKRKSFIAYEKNGETLVSIDISINDMDDFLLPYFNVDVRIYPGEKS